MLKNEREEEQAVSAGVETVAEAGKEDELQTETSASTTLQGETSGEAQEAAAGLAAELEPELSPEEKNALLEAQLTEANNQYLRKAADFENYRKRMMRERQEAVEYANQALLLDLIEIIDNFERAIKAGDENLSGQEDGKAQIPLAVLKTYHEGIQMIEKRMSAMLENKWGLKRFDSRGQPFDHNRHEAIMMDKSPDIEEPIVEEEFNKGYTLKERVVRSAKVKVLMPEKN